MIVYKELSSVEDALGFPAKTLYGISNNISKHYHTAEIPKRDGTLRTLSVPDEILKRIQRSIADNLLAYEPVSCYAKAYKVASGIRNNALPHTGKAKLLKLDIYRFFDSILYSTVKEKVFPADKYAEPIRVLLSMLCYYQDVLPQGAPSSPMITNIILRDFDELVGEWCGERKITYTRYCDDMTFSGDFDEDSVIAMVSSELKKLGYFLNNQKTAVISASRRQTVTGLVVNEKLNISKDYKRQLRKEIFYCRKFGIENHLQHSNLNISPEQYLTKLQGKINYVLQICPEDETFRAYKELVLLWRKNGHT